MLTSKCIILLRAHLIKTLNSNLTFILLHFILCRQTIFELFIWFGKKKILLNFYFRNRTFIFYYYIMLYFITIMAFLNFSLIFTELTFFRSLGDHRVAFCRTYYNVDNKVIICLYYNHLGLGFTLNLYYLHALNCVIRDNEGECWVWYSRIYMVTVSPVAAIMSIH